MRIPENFKKLFFNMSVSYVNSFLGFITFLLLARLLGAIDYSMVAIGIAIGGFVMPLLNMGSAKTFVRDAVALKSSGDVENLTQESFNIRLTVTIFVSLVLLIFSYFYMDTMIDSVAVVLLSLWVGLIGLYPASWFDYFHKTSQQNLCTMVERVLVVVMLGVLLKIESQTIIIISAILLMSRVISIVYQVKFWRKKFVGNHFRFKFKFRFPRFGSQGINIVFTIAMLSNALLIYGNQLILADNGNSIELSSYSFAFQLVGLILLFQTQAMRLFNRGISEVCLSGTKAKLFKHLIYRATFMGIVSTILAFLIFIMAKYIPDILDDDRFKSVTQFMPVLCVWVIISGVGQIITQYLLEVRQEFFHLVTCLIGGIIAFLLGLLFVPDYGAISVALILILVHSLAIGARIMRLIYVCRSHLGDET